MVSTKTYSHGFAATFLMVLYILVVNKDCQSSLYAKTKNENYLYAALQNSLLKYVMM